MPLQYSIVIVFVWRYSFNASWPATHLQRLEWMLTKVFSETALFETAERCSDVGLLVSVDEHRASLQPLSHTHHLGHVLREDSRCQTILCRVRSTQNAVNITEELYLREEDELVVEVGDDHDRAEGLLFCREVVILDIRKDGGLEEETWSVDSLAADLQLRPILTLSSSTSFCSP